MALGFQNCQRRGNKSKEDHPKARAARQIPSLKLLQVILTSTVRMLVEKGALVTFYDLVDGLAVDG